MKNLTKIEETVMIAVWRLKDDAYGVTIRDQIKEVTGRRLLYNTLYSTLDQLARKGYLIKRYGKPTAIRGGKRKIFFDLTESGLKSLYDAYKEKNTVWNGITEESFYGNMINE
ncbi:PadR family transcriptional regulator [candidate division KSB1 bacterium]